MSEVIGEEVWIALEHNGLVHVGTLDSEWPIVDRDRDVKAVVFNQPLSDLRVIRACDRVIDPGKFPCIIAMDGKGTPKKAQNRRKGNFPIDLKRQRINLCKLGDKVKWITTTDMGVIIEIIVKDEVIGGQRLTI